MSRSSESIAATPREVVMRVRFGRGILLASLVCVGIAGTSRAQGPVDDLRRVLQSGADDTTAEALDFRKAKAREAIDRMATIGQLRRALILDEWKVDPNRVINEGIRAIDLDTRKLVGERLAGWMRLMADRGDANARLAVANLAAEMGPTVRALEPGEKGGYGKSLLPIVAKLCQDDDLGVRQEALRALGNLNAEPREVAKIYVNALRSDAEVGPKRLAADGLHQMVRVVHHLQKRSQSAAGVEASRKDLLDTIQAVVPAATAAVADGDSEVRALALASVQSAAQAVAEFMEIPENVGRKNYPPEGRKLTLAERARIIEKYKELASELTQIQPAIDAFRVSVPTFAPLLADAEPRVRLAACQTFENLGNARLRMLRRANTLPTLHSPTGQVEASPASLHKAADFLDAFLASDLGQVASLVRDPDVRIRRAAVEILEVLEDRALPCLSALVGATQDHDRFVRWTAAKTLGLLPADRAAGEATPALAGLLQAPDLNLRIAAAASLEAIGPQARGAIGALVQSLQGGDAESRLATIYALARIGAGAEAVPALANLLTGETRIVRAACEALADIGPAAGEALPSLRRLLGHDDAEVRSSASEAILSILRLDDRTTAPVAPPARVPQPVQPPVAPPLAPVLGPNDPVPPRRVDTLPRLPKFDPDAPAPGVTPSSKDTVAPPPAKPLPDPIQVPFEPPVAPKAIANPKTTTVPLPPPLAAPSAPPLPTIPTPKIDDGPGAPTGPIPPLPRIEVPPVPPAPQAPALPPIPSLTPAPK